MTDDVGPTKMGVIMPSSLLRLLRFVENLHRPGGLGAQSGGKSRESPNSHMFGYEGGGALTTRPAGCRRMSDVACAPPLFLGAPDERGSTLTPRGRPRETVRLRVDRVYRSWRSARRGGASECRDSTPPHAPPIPRGCSW